MNLDPICMNYPSTDEDINYCSQMHFTFGYSMGLFLFKGWVTRTVDKFVGTMFFLAALAFYIEAVPLFRSQVMHKYV